ncbi:hypothetical protein BC628DRAFT_1414038 [Trametes gibbosa]|nr:hypothetical protein BC628DRAFT_1414038 [Trametes gibbosa]
MVYAAYHADQVRYTDATKYLAGRCQLLKCWECCSLANILLKFLKSLQARNIQVSKLSSAFCQVNMHAFDQMETTCKCWITGFKLIVIRRPIYTIKNRPFIDISCPYTNPICPDTMNVDQQPEQPPIVTAATGNSIMEEFFMRSQTIRTLQPHTDITHQSTVISHSTTPPNLQVEDGTVRSTITYPGSHDNEPTLGLHLDTSGMDIDLNDSNNAFHKVHTTALSGNITPALAPTRATTLLQYADREIIAKKLRGESKDSFLKWCSAGSDECEVALGAMIFAIMDAHRNFTRPQACIVDKKQWGLPANLRRQDEEKWGVIISKARGFMINRKSDIKKALIASMGIVDSKSNKTVAPRVAGKLHIYQLCKYLAGSLGSKSQTNTNITVRIQLCTRVAFLRSWTTKRME